MEGRLPPKTTNKQPMLHKIPRKHLPHFRIIVQTSFLLFCIYSGWRFYLFIQWITGKSSIFVPRPPSVEAFLPISALVSLKRLIFTGIYDTIHPAGLTILLAALTIAFFLRKGFCGWICPVGFASNLIEKCALKLKTLCNMPKWLDWLLLSIKYLLLGFFIFAIFYKMSLQSIEGFQNSLYNIIVDAKMLYFFLQPSKSTSVIMIFLLVVSLFSRNFWCRYLCPYGALLGLLAVFSPFQVRRNSNNCIKCQKCNHICPASIIITDKHTVQQPECIGCLECIAVCPPEDCISLTITAKKKMSAFLLPTLILSVFFVFWASALNTGNWHSKIPIETLKRYYSTGIHIPHP